MAKILVVDDAAFMRSLIKKALNDQGYMDVFEAADGVEAIEKYHELHPELVFMNITMPNLNGLEALKKIYAYDKEAKIIMCSAMGQESIVVSAVKNGAKDFIVKPFKPSRIVKAVKDMGL